MDESVEAMLEVVAYELVRNQELRAFVTGLVGD
jgi:hypothetical protein